MGKLRITYNAPVVLTFTLAAVVVFGITEAMPSVKAWFTAYPSMDWGTKSYVGMFSHILGHANWAHLMGNFMLILLIGPILEERHGSVSLLVMMLIAALVTGIINVTFASHSLLGASGIVFMMILLASTANIRAGEIPLTFIAIALVYLGGEIVAELRSSEDKVSHMGHLIGGAVGGIFGFLSAKGKPETAKPITLGGPSIVLPKAKPVVKPKRPSTAV